MRVTPLTIFTMSVEFADNSQEDFEFSAPNPATAMEAVERRYHDDPRKQVFITARWKVSNDQ